MSDQVSIVLAHGEFAAGLVSAVEQITGMGEPLRRDVEHAG